MTDPRTPAALPADDSAPPTPPRPRVLFLVASDVYFCSHRLGLAQAIAAAGYEVHVATPPGRMRHKIEASGLRFWPIGIDRQGRNPFNDIGTLWRLVKLYRSVRPQLVHHVALKPIIYGSIAARIARVPAVVNAVAGMGYVFLSRQLLSRLLRPGIMTAFRILLNAPNSRVILQNPDDRQRWISWRVMLATQIVIVRGSGVDTREFCPSPEPQASPLVVLPARLLFDKGVGEFVEAARALRSRGVEARFALVGERDPGNPASVSAQELDEWEKEGVELFGWRDDMAAIFAQAHIVCLPSYGEGLPKALLEAAASGRAIVTTDVPGCREAVRDGENGLLVPARQIAPLADALERLIRDGDMRRRMGARGRELAVAEFSSERVAAETLRVYDELLGSTSTMKQCTEALLSTPCNLRASSRQP